jgi:hypothetical protein
MTFSGHERLKNKSSGSGPDARLDGTGNAAEAGASSIDLDEARVADGSAVSAV